MRFMIKNFKTTKLNTKLTNNGNHDHTFADASARYFGDPSLLVARRERTSKCCRHYG